MATGLNLAAAVHTLQNTSKVIGTVVYAGGASAQAAPVRSKLVSRLALTSSQFRKIRNLNLSALDLDIIIGDCCRAGMADGIRAVTSPAVFGVWTTY
jgi:hypothetical protein